MRAGRGGGAAECSPASLFNADGSRAALESNVDASAAVAITAAGAATTVPATSADFDRTWRRNCTTTQDKCVAVPPFGVPLSFSGVMRLYAMCVLQR